MARIPSADEISRMSHEDLLKAWIAQEEGKQSQQAEIDKEADYEPVSEAGDLQAEIDRISKLSPEELEEEWLKQEEAANKSVKKSAKVTAEDIAWLRKAQQEHRERLQSQRVRIEKVMPFLKIE